LSRNNVSLFAHYLSILFGILFGVFLGIALWYVVAGLQPEENTAIAYAFFSLIIGASFQIIAYLVNGNILNTPSIGLKRAQNYRLICITTLAIILTSGLVFAYQNVSTAGTRTSIFPPNPTTSPIMARVYYTRILPEPLNETIVSFGVLANGSEPPYTYTAKWSDNFSQTNDYGTFSRNFSQGEEIPLSVTVVVTSSSNKSFTIQLMISPTITSTITTNSESTSSIEFLETGLPASESWSVELNGTAKSSHNSSIAFVNMKRGIYDFIVSYQFDGNYDSVFNFTPRMGLLTDNGTNYIQKVSFSSLPSDQLLTPFSSPAFTNENGSSFLTVSYLSHLPTSINATVVALINSSSGQVATVLTSEINLKPYSTSQSTLYITTLESGNYYATIYVLSNRETISQQSNLTFSIPSS